MKKTFKKLLCAAVAAVSISALVTVPSSLNKSNSANTIVNVIEVNAAKKSKGPQDYTVYVNGTGSLEFELQVNKLNGRLTPDGTTVYTLKKDKNKKIWIKKIRVEKYGSEIRIWGYTDNKYYCNDGVTRQIWVCLSRTTYDAAKHLTNVHTQCTCSDKTYGKLINKKILNALLSPDYHLRENNPGYINCFKINGSIYVIW